MYYGDGTALVSPNGGACRVSQLELSRTTLEASLRTIKISKSFGFVGKKWTTAVFPHS